MAPLGSPHCCPMVLLAQKPAFPPRRSMIAITALPAGEGHPICVNPFQTVPEAFQHFLRPSIPVVRPLHGIVYALSPSIPNASRRYSGQYPKATVQGNTPRKKGNIPQFYSSLIYSAHTHRFASLSSRILDTGFILPARLLLPLKALSSSCLIHSSSSFTGILTG